MILTSLMRSSRRVLRHRTVAILMAMVYLFAGWLTLDVQLHHDSMAALGCQTISSSEACMVDMGAHISWWERVFTSTGASQEGAHLLSAISLLAVLGCIVMAANAVSEVRSRQRSASKDPPEQHFRNYLLVYYSQGTAQPLLYA